MSEFIEVVQFERRGGADQVSIERVFAQVRVALPADIHCRVRICPHLSRGLARRVLNTGFTALNRGVVNHVTGDTHYLALGLPGERTVLTVHDCVSLARLSGLKRRLFRWLWYVLPVRRAGVVSVVSESTRRELLREAGWAADKVRVVPNCVRAEFVPAPRRFNEREPTLLQVGTGPNKNVVRVAAALEGVRCRLVVIGGLGVAEREALERHRVRFTNIPRATDAEVAAAYRECDVVVFASTYEGFGLPILEGNATGRAVVTSGVSAMPEVAGPAACLVAPTDAGSVREGILRVMGNRQYREGLVASGFENVKRFKPEIVAGQYAAIYRELAGRRRG